MRARLATDRSRVPHRVLAALAWLLPGMAGGLPTGALGVEPPRAAVGTETPRAASEPTTRRRKTAGFDMVRFGQNVHVHRDEVIRGDVVVLGGDLRVEGEITGDAVTFGGNIEAARGSRIGGQAVAVGGSVDAAAESEVASGVVGLSFLPEAVFRHAGAGRLWRVGLLISDLVRLVFAALGAVLLAALFPGRLRRASEFLDGAFLRSFGLGMLGLTGGLFAILVASVLLAITLLGIPLAFVLLASAGLLTTAGWAVGAMLVGRHAAQALRLGARHPIAQAVLGALCLALPELLADLFGLVSSRGVTVGLGWRLAYGALVLTMLAAGLGATLWTGLGGRERSDAGSGNWNPTPTPAPTPS